VVGQNLTEGGELRSRAERAGMGVIKSAVPYAVQPILSRYLFQYPSAQSTLRESMIRAFFGVRHAPAVFRRS